MLTQLKTILLFILITFSFSVLSQNEYGSQEEMQEAASELFSNENYSQAFPLYSQLLSLDRENFNLNYRFGVCLLYSDRSDTYAPIEYLKKALGEIPDVDLYYHLGFAYHINYNFPAAISFYKDYLNRVGKKNKSFEVERKIEMCQNGMELLKSVKDLFVLQKSEVNRQEFFRSYDLMDFDGRIIKKPENFKNKEDAKAKKKDFIFFNSKANEIYYSSYGKENKNNKDIYRRIKKEEGGWSEPIRLPSTINTPYDEDFAVMMPDGITLYFSSKGHNTIGGFDIFKSIFDEGSRSWSEPENINFPFNTPVDDILFVSDSSETAAWFASVRNSVDDKIMVYKVGIIKRPEGSNDLAAIYAKNSDLSNADLNKIKDRAKLDVNISEQEYEDIPVIIDNPITDIYNKSLSGEEVMAEQLKQKEREQQLIDSASSFVNQIEQNIHSFESAQLQALEQASNKKVESTKLKEEVVNNLKQTQQTSDLDNLQSLVAKSNVLLAEAERLDFEIIELESFARESQGKIDEQRLVFNDLNQKYGDAEKAVISGNQEEASLILNDMQGQWNEIYSSSDKNAELAKEDIKADAIQYPQELENVSEFKAFAVSSQNNEQQYVEAFSSRFEVYLPIQSISNAQVENIGASDDPFTKVEEYLTVLEEKSKNIRNQIAENEFNQSDLIESFEALDETQKVAQLALINKNASETAQLQSELNWVLQSADELEDFKLPQNVETNKDKDLQVELVEKTQELENTFDFNNQIFSSSIPQSVTIAATPYIMNDEGKVSLASNLVSEEEVSEEKNVNDAEELKVLKQSSIWKEEMLLAYQKSSDDWNNSQSKLVELESNMLNSFEQANENLSLAKAASTDEKEVFLNQANQEYGWVQKYASDIESVQSLNEKLKSNTEQSKLILEQMNAQITELEESEKELSIDDWSEISITLESEFAEFQILNKRIEEASTESNDIQLQISANESTPIEVYKMDENGSLTKNIGYDQKEWNTIRAFMEDVNIGNAEDQVFTVASSIDFEPKVAQLLNEAFPKLQKTDQQLFLKDFNSADESNLIENGMFQSMKQQLLSLQSETRILIEKRNQLNSFYQDKASYAKEMEELSFMAIQGQSVDIKSIEKANQLSYEAKKGFFEASIAAHIIQDYDQEILENTALLTSSISSMKEMQQYLEQDNESEATRINNQLQEDINTLSENEKIDQGFDFASNEFVNDLPADFESSLNTQYEIIDGQIYAIDLTEAISYNQLPKSNNSVDVFSSPIIITEDEYLIDEQKKIAAIQVNEENQMAELITNEPNQTTELNPDSAEIVMPIIEEDTSIASIPIQDANEPNQTTELKPDSAEIVIPTIEEDTSIASIPIQDANEPNQATELKPDSAEIVVPPIEEDPFIASIPIQDANEPNQATEMKTDSAEIVVPTIEEDPSIASIPIQDANEPNQTTELKPDSGKIVISTIEEDPSIASIPIQDANESNQTTELEPDSNEVVVPTVEEDPLIASLPIQDVNQSSEEFTSTALDVSGATEIELRSSVQEKVDLSQSEMNKIEVLGVSLTNAAEEKIIKSNDLSLQLEGASDPQQRKMLQDSAQHYLYQALAIKAVTEEYQQYVDVEKTKQKRINQYALNIDTQFNLGNEEEAKELYRDWQDQNIIIDDQPEMVLQNLRTQMSSEPQELKGLIDSAYSISQEKANESAKLLAEAAATRDKANGKRSAFKRRELLEEAASKELKATQFQNESEEALNYGNMLYQQSLAYEALVAMSNDFSETNLNILGSSAAANREVVFENIESRKASMLNSQYEPVIEEGLISSPNVENIYADDLHVFERENFKAEMISEELELVKREIALLLQAQNAQNNPGESVLIEQKVRELRTKADSLDLEANKAFELANRILTTLPEEEQKEAHASSRDFNTYLGDLKAKIDALLSEASSYKQRAQRSNDIETSEDLLAQAKAKEEVAVYLILEEFEIIAQKNKTRYRKNQLVLQQLLMDNASPQERDLMRNIFDQIDDYFEQARLKREKANRDDISFNMKKILLQDAYSLEMKALDLQIKVKDMLEDHDVEGLLALQSNVDTSGQALALQENNNQERPVLDDNSSKPLSSSLIRSRQEEVVEPSPVSQDGLIYKVQIAAIREFVPNSYFDGVTGISAELVTGTDFVRYFSGEFIDLNNAIIRRNSLRASGYPEAFIRSWRDGDAVSLLDLQDEETQVSPALSVSASPRTTRSNVDFSATNISTLGGVYYTVQIGVYSRPRTSSMIFGIKPLFHKRMQNGYWVYYSGVYNSIAVADIRKDEIIAQGVSDAFVVAFNNGESIGLSEARQEMNRGGVVPLDEDITILEEASTQIENDWISNQNKTANTGMSGFRVQVGVYSNPINLDWISSQMDDDYQVEYYQSTTGKYIYTLGNFNEVSGARSILQEVKELVPDAFIVNYENGVKKYIGN